MPWFLNKQGKAIMNMPLVLNMPGFLNIKLYLWFGICQGSEYTRVWNFARIRDLAGF